MSPARFALTGYGWLIYQLAIAVEALYEDIAVIEIYNKSARIADKPCYTKLPSVHKPLPRSLKSHLANQDSPLTALALAGRL